MQLYPEGILGVVIWFCFFKTDTPERTKRPHASDC